MEHVTILMDGRDEEDPIPADGPIVKIVGLPGVTKRGLAGVAIDIQLHDGTIVRGQTTLALLYNAVQGLSARYPDPR